MATNLEKRISRISKQLERDKKRIAQLLDELKRDVDRILKDEAEGNEGAFADWLYGFYVGGLNGEKLTDFNAFMESPLALDMIADWKHECDTHMSRVELIDHIFSHYAADDFDEQEHFDENGDSIHPYGDPNEKHFDARGKPIPPHVPSSQRRAG